jgi:hypothetical protein
MTATHLRASATLANDRTETPNYALGNSALGPLIASTAKGVASILIGDDPHALMRS